MPTSQITSTTGSAKTLGQLTVTGPIPLSLSLYDKSAKMLSLWKIVIPQTTPTSSERVWCRAYQRQCYCHSSSKNHFPFSLFSKDDDLFICATRFWIKIITLSEPHCWSSDWFHPNPWRLLRRQALRPTSRSKGLILH